MRWIALVLLLLIPKDGWAIDPVVMAGTFPPNNPSDSLYVKGFVSYVSDQIIVQLKPSLGSAIESDVLNSYTATANEGLFQKPITSTMGDYHRVTITGDLDSVVALFEADPFVDHVEKIEIFAVDVEPNDPYFRTTPFTGMPTDQWGLWGAKGIQADLAWAIEPGDSTVVVAIADTGVRYYHLDFGFHEPWAPTAPKGGTSIFVNWLETPNNGIDDDGNGYVDDVIGWDFVHVTSGCTDNDCLTPDNDPDDYHLHGTHVAGTVGAITNNNRMVAGAANYQATGAFNTPHTGVKILPLRIGWSSGGSGFVRMDFAAEAFNYLANLKASGVNVAAVNCSWGSGNSGGIAAATTNLVAQDVLVVVSAGNAGNSVAAYLPSRADCMSVAATTSTGTRASFSSYGSWVDIAAPGFQILSTFSVPQTVDPNPRNYYMGTISGTSMSAPHVCAVAALLESCNPLLTYQQKWNKMQANTTAYTSSVPIGAGIVNAFKAVSVCGSIP